MWGKVFFLSLSSFVRFIFLSKENLSFCFGVLHISRLCWFFDQIPKWVQFQTYGGFYVLTHSSKLSNFLVYYYHTTNKKRDHLFQIDQKKKTKEIWVKVETCLKSNKYIPWCPLLDRNPENLLLKKKVYLRFVLKLIFLKNIPVGQILTLKNSKIKKVKDWKLWLINRFWGSFWF